MLLAILLTFITVLFLLLCFVIDNFWEEFGRDLIFGVIIGIIFLGVVSQIFSMWFFLVK